MHERHMRRVLALAERALGEGEPGGRVVERAARADLHLHSDHSVDSHAPLEAMCRAAVERGLETVCFTEHVDLDPRDDGYGYLNWDAYSRAVDAARERFAGRLTILQGVEIGEPHRYPRDLERLAALRPDVILGSVHWLPEGFVGASDVRRAMGLEGLFAAYYREMLAAVRHGGFDVLAHLDFPKRYHGEALGLDEVVEAILSEAVARGLAIEVNTSPLRKGLEVCAPDLPVLARYRALGGSRVTLGSDAHAPEEVGAGLGRALEIVRRAGVGPVGVFCDRRFVSLEAPVQ